MDKPDDKPTKEQVDKVMRVLFNLPDPPPKAQKVDPKVQEVINHLKSPN